MNSYKKEMDVLVGEILGSYQKYPQTCSIHTRHRLNNEIIIDLLDKIRCVVFPGFFETKTLNENAIEYHVGELLEDIQYRLTKQVTKALFHSENAPGDEEAAYQQAKDIVHRFLQRIPALRAILATDVQAAYDGDPAAFNTDEVIFSYPGVFAITVNRIAHELHILGVVIGETTTIGTGAKIYQGVTLGALSTRGGQTLRSTKRHPTLEDNVTVYSGASILGGETVIGEGAIIGSNAFITSSVPGGTRVSIKNPELQFKDRVRMTELGQEGFWKGND